MFIVLLKKLEILGTGSLGISLFYLSAGIPAFLFAIPAGAFVEKSKLQKTMITTDILRAILVLSFICINLFIIQSPIIIYTLLFLITINDMFFLTLQSVFIAVGSSRKTETTSKWASTNSYDDREIIVLFIGRYTN